MKPVLFILILLFATLSELAYSQELTKQQADFVATISGEWQVRKAYMDGAPFNDRLYRKSVRISEGKVWLLPKQENLALREGQHSTEPPFLITNVDPNAKKIEMMIELDNNIHRFILHMDGDLMWLVCRCPGNSELPEKLKPTQGNFCMALSRSKALDLRSE